MSAGYSQQQYPYNHNQQHQQYQQESSYYPSDRKVAPLDDSHYSPQYNSEPVYPPIPVNIHFNTSNPSAAPYMLHPASSEGSTQMKPYSASSIDLETVGTDDGATDNSSYPTYTEPKAKDDETGIRAALFPNSITCRIYLLVVLVETIIDLAIEASVLVRLDAMATQSNTNSKFNGPATTQTRQPVYLGIFALAHVLQMILAVDAVYNKNTLQFLFLAIFNFMLIVYGLLQIFEVQENINSFALQGVSIGGGTIKGLMIAVPCVSGLAEIAYIALGWKIWKEFGWKVYKFLGADRNIKKMYAQYQIFECLLKFDIFFYVGFSVQWLSLVLYQKDFEFWATAVALPVSLLLLVEGLLAARHENKWMMGSFMFGCVAGCAYFVYKGFRVFTDRKDVNFIHLYKSLLIFACLSIVFLLMTFISAVIVMLNFGKGLKQSMNKKKAAAVIEDGHKLERRGTEYKGAHRPAGYNPKRMSIE